MFKRHRKEREKRLEEVAKEHVRHLSGETAAGRTDPATTDRSRRRKTSPEEDASQGRTAAPGGSDTEDRHDGT
ncbi:MAG TPA: hypothetical protein VE546_20660 [Streptomyces sp.]|uniref:hypothetical protein n=1 Tax=Streptomyces sp. TaxID=1931 RepID=UPI002D49926B|nr:hypothetical protein [Streptomyces sp.]HZG05955.1 hypothetical protein [Streptomyces sp.]